MESEAKQTQRDVPAGVAGGIPLDDFAFGERIINAIRWPLIAILFFFNNLGFTQDSRLVWPINGLVLLAVVVTGYIQYRLHQGRSLGRPISLALAVIQDSLITLGVSLTGAYDSHFFIFYYPSLLGFSVAFSLRVSLAYATVVGLAYSLVSWFLTPGLSENPLAVQVLIERWTVLYIVVVIGWFLVRQERIRRGEAIAIERRMALENRELYQQLNAQMENWRLIVETNQKTARQLASLAEDLAGLADEIGVGAEEIAVATQEITGRAITFVDQVETIAQVTDQVVAASHDLAASAGPTGTASEQARQAVSQATEAVQALSRRSQAIGSLAAAVRRVADQTNLLAFNANIEAIQAGDGGQRFSVVAHEVRQVAEQAIGLAREIDELSDEVRYGTGQVLDAMAEIAEMVNQTTSLVRVTSDASQSQQSSANVLAGSVSALQGVSQQNAADLQGVSATVQQQRAALKRIADLSQVVADSAGNLSSRTTTLAG
jgi:methyl-accepting chemotaxis protein